MADTNTETDRCTVCLSNMLSEDLETAQATLALDQHVHRQEVNDSCNDDDDGEMLIGTLIPCNHFMHDKCIQSWANIANTCPICRASFNEVQVSTHVRGMLAENYWIPYIPISHHPENADCYLKGPCIKSYAIENKTQAVAHDDGGFFRFTSRTTGRFFNNQLLHSQLLTDRLVTLRNFELDQVEHGMVNAISLRTCLVCHETGNPTETMTCNGCSMSCHLMCATSEDAPLGTRSFRCRPCRALVNMRGIRSTPASNTRHVPPGPVMFPHAPTRLSAHPHHQQQRRSTWQSNWRAAARAAALSASTQPVDRLTGLYVYEIINDDNDDDDDEDGHYYDHDHNHNDGSSSIFRRFRDPRSPWYVHAPPANNPPSMNNTASRTSRVSYRNRLLHQEFGETQWRANRELFTSSQTPSVTTSIARRHLQSGQLDSDAAASRGFPRDQGSSQDQIPSRRRRLQASGRSDPNETERPRKRPRPLRAQNSAEAGPSQPRTTSTSRPPNPAPSNNISPNFILSLMDQIENGSPSSTSSSSLAPSSSSEIRRPELPPLTLRASSSRNERLEGSPPYLFPLPASSSSSSLSSSSSSSSSHSSTPLLDLETRSSIHDLVTIALTPRLTHAIITTAQFADISSDICRRICLKVESPGSFRRNKDFWQKIAAGEVERVVSALDLSSICRARLERLNLHGFPS